ncbi:MAG: hypothetical protein K0Q76_529 [Panacagrimonas sp.]|nr:hypothetical protein [Panacagrimonas sp.]MCC2655421.1 hypothetical protein [Panacagrimonas sp.]
MRARGIWMVPAVLVMAGCSMFPFKKNEANPDNPEAYRSESEEILTVSAELPPIEQEAAAPQREVRRPTAGSTPRGFEEESRTLGNDPRRRAIAEGGVADATPRMTKVATAPALVRPSESAVIAPMAGRVGVMSLLGNELKHVRASSFGVGGDEQSYNVQYDFSGYVMEELRKNLLTKTPYQPVTVNPTGLLRRDAATWASTWNGNTFGPDYQREFDGIIKQNRLAMLIVVSYATIGDGQLIGGRKLNGSGLYTRGRNAAVFSTLQFYRLVGTPAQLVYPIAPDGERSIGDLPNAQLPKDLDNLPPRYLVPVYEPLRMLVQNKIHGLVSLPRKLGY